MKLFLLSVLILFASSCTTYPFDQGRADYIALVDKHSAGDIQFSGFYENFEFRSTLLTQEMSQALLERLKLYYQWSEEDYSKEKQQRMGDLSKKTKIWLSFYTPERKNDNLANKISIWKIYLDSNGTRYEGRAIKANMNRSEAQSIFHYHTRWASAYYVEFDIPTSDLSSAPKLTITGPLGNREVHFK